MAPILATAKGALSSLPTVVPREAEFLDEIQTKVSRVSLRAIHSHLYSLQLWLLISISSNSRNLLQFLEFSFLYTVKEKGGKPERKPHLLPYGLRNPYRNLMSENSQDYAQKPQRNCTSAWYLICAPSVTVHRIICILCTGDQHYIP